MLKKVCIILSVILVLGVVGIFVYQKATDYIVKKTLITISDIDDQTMQEIIREFQEYTFEQTDGNTAPAASGNPAGDSNPAEDSNSADNGNASDAPKAEGDASPSVGDKKPSANTSEKPGNATTDSRADGQSATSAPTATEKGSVDHVQADEKAYIMSIYSRFSVSDVSSVQAMMQDGLTREEKQQIKSIVFSKVSTEELQRLQELSKKYR